MKTPNGETWGDAKHDKLLSIPDVCERLHFTDRWVRELLSKGKLKGLQHAPKSRWLIPESEVIRFLQGGKTPDIPRHGQARPEPHVPQAEHAARQIVDGSRTDEQEQHVIDLLQVADRWISSLQYPDATRIPFVGVEERFLLDKTGVEPLEISHRMYLSKTKPWHKGLVITSALSMHFSDDESRPKYRWWLQLLEHLITCEALKARNADAWLEEWVEKEGSLETECVKLFERIEQESKKLLQAGFEKMYMATCGEPQPEDSSPHLREMESKLKAVLREPPEELKRHAAVALLRSAYSPLAIEGDKLILGFGQKRWKEKCEEPANAAVIVSILASVFPDIRRFSAVLVPQTLQDLTSGKLRQVDDAYYEAIYRSALHPQESVGHEQSLKWVRRWGQGGQPRLDEEDVELMWSTYGAVVRTYATSPEVVEIRHRNEEYQKLLDGLRTSLEFIVDSRGLPGWCKICRNRQNGLEASGGEADKSSPVHVEPSNTSPQALTEQQRARIRDSLRSFRHGLVGWMYSYAIMLSGKFNTPDHWEWSDQDYQKDLPELEDVFGIAVWGPDGKRIRGTSDCTQLRKHPYVPDSIRWNLGDLPRILKPIEERIETFPSLLDHVSQETANVKLLRGKVAERLRELGEWERQWEIRHGEERPRPPRIMKFDDLDDAATRHNLRAFGGFLLNCLIAIDADIKRFAEKQRPDLKGTLPQSDAVKRTNLHRPGAIGAGVDTKTKERFG